MGIVYGCVWERQCVGIVYGCVWEKECVGIVYGCVWERECVGIVDLHVCVCKYVDMCMDAYDMRV